MSKIEDVTEVETGDCVKNNRFNDGKADPSGRLWAGTMGFEPVPGQIDKFKGSLYSVVSRNEIKSHLDKVSIANGLAWDTKKNKFYYIDSPTRKVDVFDYNAKTGTISKLKNYVYELLKKCKIIYVLGNRQTAFDFDKYDIPGVPDGMTIDTDGNLWVAVFDGARVLHINPCSGELMTTIDIPAKQVCSIPEV